MRDLGQSLTHPQVLMYTGMYSMNQFIAALNLCETSKVLSINELCLAGDDRDR